MAIAQSFQFTRLREWCRTGEALRLRVDARLSQGELARDARTSVANISRWEHCVNNPRGAGALRYYWLLVGLKALERTEPAA
jgi:DNA-binding transcriptional regulator YiaG